MALIQLASTHLSGLAACMNRIERRMALDEAPEAIEKR